MSKRRPPTGNLLVIAKLLLIFSIFAAVKSNYQLWTTVFREKQQQ